MNSLEAISKAHEEVLKLKSFARRELCDSDSEVAKEVHRLVLSLEEKIETAHKKLKVAESRLERKSAEKSTGVNADEVQDVPDFLLPIAMSNDLKLPLQTPTEVIALFCHSVFAKQGFVCLMEKSGGGVPGFAAPLSVLPKGSLVPQDWNKQKDFISFQYKHKASPGKYFVLHTSLSTPELTIVKIGLKSEPASLLEICLVNSELVNVSSISECTLPIQLCRLFISPDEFASLIVSSLISKFSFVSNEKPMVEAQEQPPRHELQSQISVKGSGMTSPQDNVPFNVGSSDLHPPLPSVVPPLRPGFGRQGQLPNLSYDDNENSTNFYHGEDGMLVGPGHAMFRGGRDFEGAPGFGPGMPQPRYDPIINPDINTDPNLIVGGRGSGRAGRQGRGRGTAPRIHGEPNPDHLQPPGFGEYM